MRLPVNTIRTVRGKAIDAADAGLIAINSNFCPAVWLCGASPMFLAAISREQAKSGYPAVAAIEVHAIPSAGPEDELSGRRLNLALGVSTPLSKITHKARRTSAAEGLATT